MPATLEPLDLDLGVLGQPSRAGHRPGFRDRAYVFQVELELECEMGFLPRPDFSGEGSADWDEQVTDLQYREHEQQLNQERRKARLVPIVEARASSTEAYAHAVLDLFWALFWPFPGNKPELYYDPRSAEPGGRHYSSPRMLADGARIWSTWGDSIKHRDGRLGWARLSSGTGQYRT